MPTPAASLPAPTRPRHAAASVLVLLALLGAPQLARAAAAPAGPAERLFALNALVFAASSVATPAEFASLRQFLLVYEPSATLDAGYPIRGALAAAVQRWPRALRLRALRFLLENPAAATNYNALVIDMFGPAPDFVPSDDAIAGGANERRVFAHRARLAALLRDAYREGGLGGSWRAMQPAWQAAQLPAPHVEALQAGVVRFLRVPAPPSLAGSSVLSNPLMPAGSGVTSLFADGHFVMLIGPTASPAERDVLVSHELAHPLVSAMLRDSRPLRQAFADSACVFAGIRRDPQAALLTGAVYTTWESYLSESLVRALSHHIIGVPDGGRGFALTHLLGAEMGHFAAHRQPFATAVADLLEQLPAEVCGSGGGTVLDAAAIDGRRALFSRL